MAVANIVGSNIFNLLMILGAGLARSLLIDPRTVTVDVWVMLAFTGWARTVPSYP
jgi:Ca2+/Na+ antiporter